MEKDRNGMVKVLGWTNVNVGKMTLLNFYQEWEDRGFLLTMHGWLDQHHSWNLPKVHWIKQLQSYAKEKALYGSCPDACEFDHRAASNRYESKYGETWLEQIHKCTALLPFRPISDLIWWMVDFTKKTGTFITMHCLYLL